MQGGVAQKVRNHRSGHVEKAHVASYLFDQQYQTFNNQQFAYDPGAAAVVGDMDSAWRNEVRVTHTR